MAKHLSAIMLLSMASYSMALEYKIAGFPDTLGCNQDSTITITLWNNTKTTVQIKEFTDPVDITYADSSGELKSIMRYRIRMDINFYEIKPGKSKAIKANLTGYYFKDSVLDSRKSRMQKDTMDNFIRTIIKRTSIPVDTSFKSEEMFQKDSDESKKQFEDGIDAILANICCTEKPVPIKIPYHSGKYSIGIYVNIVDLKSSKDYYFIKRDIFIRCK